MNSKDAVIIGLAFTLVAVLAIGPLSMAMPAWSGMGIPAAGAQMGRSGNGMHGSNMQNGSHMGGMMGNGCAGMMNSPEMQTQMTECQQHDTMTQEQLQQHLQYCQQEMAEHHP